MLYTIDEVDSLVIIHNIVYGRRDLNSISTEEQT